jgi:hypothetical protein
MRDVSETGKQKPVGLRGEVTGDTTPVRPGRRGYPQGDQEKRRFRVRGCSGRTQ